MGENSNIAWTDHTYNPWIGCTKVGVGCEGCYAEAYDNRFGGGHWGAGAPRRRTSEQTRNLPRRWNRAAQVYGTTTKVFAHSLSDVFDNEVPQDWREEEFRMWRETPHLRWIVLTKRPGNIAKMLPADWSREVYPNVGFCCSVATQKEFDRDVPVLMSGEVDAAWLGISIEPQVERIVITNRMGLVSFQRIAWIITGGASAQRGYETPSYDVYWARSLIDQCRDYGIACFVKQIGSNPFNREKYMEVTDKAGANPEEWPEDIRVRQFPPELTR